VDGKSKKPSIVDENGVQVGEWYLSVTVDTRRRRARNEFKLERSNSA